MMSSPVPLLSREAQSTDRFPSNTNGPSESDSTMAPPLPFAVCDDDGDAATAGEKRALLSESASSSERDGVAWLARLERGADAAVMERDQPHPDVILEKHVDKPRHATRATDEWEVIVPLGFSTATCCSGERSTRVVEVVTLRHANFGLRWAGATAKRRRHRRLEARGDEDCEAKSAGPPFCIVGPHWWLMAATFSVLLVAALVVTVLTIPQAGPGEAAMGILLSAACLTMYAKVACSNPGIVERLDEPLSDDYTYCGECESFRPPDALHCMDCRACIEGYDHHCPWTGKCIGKSNVKYFYAWLFFLVLAFVYEMIEFTTYMLPPEDQPHPYLFDDDDDSFSLRGVTGSPPRLSAGRTLPAAAPPSPALRQP